MTSSTDNSSFYGLNAAILAYGSSASSATGGSVAVTGGTITTTGQGANGVFASGDGAAVTMSGLTITTSGANAHGIDAAEDGVLSATNVTATTTGASSSVIATDRGGGTVTVSGGTFTASGYRSAGVYSTGTVTISGATLTANAAEVAVVEGGNSLSITNSSLTSTNANEDRGIFLYQSASGDASSGGATLTIKGGSYAYTTTSGPAFYVTNQTAAINLTGVTVTNSSTTLLKAAADSWGTSGSNGGTVTFTASGETLTGDVVADSISTVTLNLKSSSTLSGAINTAKTAESVALTLDASSSWTASGVSYVTTLTDSDATLSNIKSAYTLYYKSSANSWLGGSTYSLSGGGSLVPY